jgi:aminocarboxymuconate-semialdehyde decarboxylase
VDKVGAQYAFRFPKSGKLAPTSVDLVDIEKSVSRLDSQGIDSAVISPWLEVVGYELQAAEGAAWARFLNEQMLDVLHGEPRLVPMATVPLQAGELAARELEAARDMGFVGVEIGTAVGDRELDDPDLVPFWEAAAEHAMPVFLHPMLQKDASRIRDDFAFGLANSVGRIVDTTIAVSRLLFSGTLARLPRLKVIVAHGGASVPYILGRLQRTYELGPDDMADPRAGFDRLYFDTVLFDAAALRFLLQAAGRERVLLGSDYPFPNRDLNPRRIVFDAVDDESDRKQVLATNATELFEL